MSQSSGARMKHDRGQYDRTQARLGRRCWDGGDKSDCRARRNLRAFLDLGIYLYIVGSASCLPDASQTQRPFNWRDEATSTVWKESSVHAS